MKSPAAAGRAALAAAGGAAAGGARHAAAGAPGGAPPAAAARRPGAVRPPRWCAALAASCSTCRRSRGGFVLGRSPADRAERRCCASPAGSAARSPRTSGRRAAGRLGLWRPLITLSYGLDGALSRLGPALVPPGERAGARAGLGAGGGAGAAGPGCRRGRRAGRAAVRRHARARRVGGVDLGPHRRLVRGLLPAGAAAGPPRAGSAGARWPGVAALAALALALLSKETALPFVLVVAVAEGSGRGRRPGRGGALAAPYALLTGLPRRPTSLGARGRRGRRGAARGRRRLAGAGAHVPGLRRVRLAVVPAHAGGHARAGARRGPGWWPARRRCRGCSCSALAWLARRRHAAALPLALFWLSLLPTRGGGLRRAATRCTPSASSTCRRPGWPGRPGRASRRCGGWRARGGPALRLGGLVRRPARGVAGRCCPDGGRRDALRVDGAPRAAELHGAHAVGASSSCTRGARRRRGASWTRRDALDPTRPEVPAIEALLAYAAAAMGAAGWSAADLAIARRQRRVRAAPAARGGAALRSGGSEAGRGRARGTAAARCPGQPAVESLWGQYLVSTRARRGGVSGAGAGGALLPRTTGAGLRAGAGGQRHAGGTRRRAQRSSGWRGTRRDDAWVELARTVRALGDGAGAAQALERAQRCRRAAGRRPARRAGTALRPRGERAAALTPPTGRC